MSLLDSVEHHLRNSSDYSYTFITIFSSLHFPHLVFIDPYLLINSCPISSFHVFFMCFKNHPLYYDWIVTLNAFCPVLFVFLFFFFFCNFITIFLLYFLI